jgi:hypothetical protein
MLLLCPVDGSMQQLFRFCHVDKPLLLFGMVAVATILRTIEVLAGLSFVAGLETRLMGYVAVPIFAVRAMANPANSFAWLRDVVNSVIVPHGDWGYGALHLGVALLLGELPGASSGRWSVDYWVSRKFRGVGKCRPHSVQLAGQDCCAVTYVRSARDIEKPGRFCAQKTDDVAAFSQPMQCALKECVAILPLLQQ